VDLALNILTWLAALTAALWVCWRLRSASRKVDSWLDEARQRADSRPADPPPDPPDDEPDLR
jgi:hypothetical protein